MRLVGSPSLTWRRFDVLCTGLAKDPASLLWRELAGDMADWDLKAQLAAATEHGVRVLAWQNTKDAAAQRNYPEPISPPGQKPPDRQRKLRVTTAALAEFQKRIDGG